MQAIWDRIEGWFKLYAPEKGSHFQPGATEDEIRQAEVAMGVQLPDDIKASYRLHNGSNRHFLIGDRQFHSLWKLHSLAEMVDHWNILKETIETTFPKQDEIVFEADFEVAEDKVPVYWGSVIQVATGWWYPEWVPILEFGNGDALCIDLAPEPAGQIGQVIEFWHETGSRNMAVAPSWQAFLVAFADDLEEGKYLSHFRPTP